MTQIHKLSLYETSSHLKDCLERSNVIQLWMADPIPIIESHVRVLLLNEPRYNNDIRNVMAEVLPTEQASELGDMIHDMLLSDLRSYMNFDSDDEQIVDVRVTKAFDLFIEVEELNILRLQSNILQDTSIEFNLK